MKGEGILQITNETSKPALKLINATEIVPQEIKWLWYPFIPFGKVTLLQGDPGDGKSTFMLHLSALLSSGKALPLCEESPPSDPINIIYLTTEDDMADTVVPRFLQAGGDRSHLTFIDESEQHITFSDERIRQAIDATGAKLLILDPLSAYIGKCSLNSANEVRPEFNYLIQTARETGCAIVVIAHLNKNTDVKSLYRAAGSIDVMGAVRSSLLIAHDPEDDNRRILVQQKANLAPIGGGLAFSITDGGIVIGEAVQYSADELLRRFGYAQRGRPPAKQQKAMELLTEFLADMERSQEDCMAHLAEFGIAESTAKKAKRELGIESLKMGSRWYWKLPG